MKKWKKRLFGIAVMMIALSGALAAEAAEKAVLTHAPDEAHGHALPVFRLE